MQYLSRYYPAYKKGGLNCEIKILAGTVIDEQIIVERADFSYISITSESTDNTVIVTPTAVNWSKGTLTHDTRGNLPFFGGEFGARLPVIKCLFKLETGNEDNTVFIEDTYYPIVGYYCNRGSMGVIAGETTYNGSTSEGLSNIGFEGFYDNVIANNNSEIVLREAIARNAGRYGVMARHISRVSARSADITGCADTAAYADRSSMMDVRFANVSGSNNGLQCFNTSNMTAVETIANNITNIVADSREGSVLNCAEMTIDTVKDVFKVLNGGAIIATSTVPTNVSGALHSKTINTVDVNGVIYARVKESNSYGADMHVAIHTNATAKHKITGGTQILLYSLDGERKKAGMAVFDRLSPITPGKSAERLIAKPGFYECNSANGLTVYCECEFHDTKEGSDFIIKNTTAIGEAIAKGICDYYGVKVTEAPEKEADDTLYCVQVGAYSQYTNAQKQLEKLKKAGFDGYITTKKK